MKIVKQNYYGNTCHDYTAKIAVVHYIFILEVIIIKLIFKKISPS